MISHQGKIIELKNNIIKKVYNEKFSIDNELFYLEKFSRKGKNIYSPNILSINKNENSYYMEKYKCSLGTTKKINENNIRRILFSISKDELFKQLDDIYRILKEENIYHRDINPGNILFCERSRCLKLIDFYWATDNINETLPAGGINGIYGTNDLKAIEKIKSQINEIYFVVRKQIKNIRKLIEKFGESYKDGSVKHKGKSYQLIDIPYFKDVEFHRNTDNEFNEIFSLISTTPKSVIDIGCASGYTLFNLIRNFNLDTVIGYEADPIVFDFLNNSKKVFCLEELTLVNGVKIETKFPQVDLIICMNVHMWLYKQFGNKVDIIIKNLISNCKEMFFQTAGSESNGKFLINDLQSKEKIYDYLKNLGSNKVEFIRSTKEHGGLRHLFKVKGLL